MRTRSVVATALVAVVAAGAGAPSFAATKAKPKPKPKPIMFTYTASAQPDPTSTNPVTNEPCVSTLPGGKFSKPFTVPAAGTLTVSLANQLDWSLAIRGADGSTEGSSDGAMPTDREQATVPFTKGRKVSIDTCNFAGEPTVQVTVRFTYK